MSKLKISFGIAGGPCISADNWKTESTPERDFWRVFLDTGENRELAVYSHVQDAPVVSCNGEKTTYHYDHLIAEDGQIFSIDLDLTIENKDGHIEFTSSVKNNSEVILNELQYPFIPSYSFGCDPAQETLFVPNGLGEYVNNPRLSISREHTEYMSADYKCTWRLQNYPAGGAARALSMPWTSLQCGDKLFYIGEHNPEMRMIGIHVGVPPRHAKSELMFCVSHYPAAHPGETVSIGRSVIALFEGDWREAADFYRKWSEETWVRPQKFPDWVQNMSGWQRVICKHQYGEIYWKYEDLPALWEEGHAVGIDGLLLFGWWKGCFDNNYPEFEADPALGGEEGLRAAIAEIQRRGGHVMLYSNGNLIDIKTNFYKEIGQRISHKDLDGNEYREHYRFSNDGSILKGFGYKSFDTACHTTPEWKENLLRVSRLKLSFGPDSIFFDQLAVCAKLCFDTSHPHGNRIDLDGEGRYNNISAIREILPEGKAIGTECVNDRYCNLIDYIHGCGSAQSYYPTAFPDIFLHTFPGIHISNRWLHDDKDGFKDHLNYAFTYGLIFDVAIYRCRCVGIGAVPAYGAYLSELLTIKDKYRKYMYHGKFRSMYGEPLPNGIRSGRFNADDGSYLLTLWNTTDADIEFELYGKQISVKAKQVTVAEYPA